MSLFRAFRVFGIVAWGLSSAAFPQSAHPTSAQAAAQSNPGGQCPLPEAPSPSGAFTQASGTVQQPSPAPSSWSSSSSTSNPGPKFWAGPDPHAHVTVLENTLFRVLTDEPFSTRETRAGATLRFTLSEDVVVDGAIVIPRGAVVHGTVVRSKEPGTLTGRPELIVKLTSLDLGQHRYPLYTYLFTVTGTSKTRPTEVKVRDGAVLGAIVGGVFSGSAHGETTAVGKLAGMGTGAVLGAGVGTMVSAATPGPILTIPAESQMDFYLALPISVIPLSPEAALKLSEGLRPGGPVLYVRGDTP